MAYASRSGRARTSAKKPRAFAVCFRCGNWYNRDQLNFQYDWRGTALQNLYILVCPRCTDTPQEQLRAIQLPADPVPVYFPSVEQFEQDETNYRTLVPNRTDPVTGLPIPNPVGRNTEDFQCRITQPIGVPNGLDQNAVMPYNGAVQRAYGVLLSPLSIIANGTDQIAVTFSQAHGLATNDQIAVEGLTQPDATGFYSVMVQSPMAFTYQTYSAIPTGSLMTGTTRMVTALVGLPYGVIRVPQVPP